jgi:hypothetical protein
VRASIPGSWVDRAELTVVRGLPLDPTPLRRREFRLLSIGQLVSFFGSMITFVALRSRCTR